MSALVSLALLACEQESSTPAAAGPVAAVPAAPRSTAAGTPAAKKAGLLAVPGDEVELQRMIDLGYTVHDDHLHPPGAKECPLMSADMVQ